MHSADMTKILKSSLHHGDTKALRALLGRFATGVTIISVMADGEPRGMTANAFMSGAIDPPLVLVSIAKGARTHAAIEASSSFAVSILSAGQADVAQCFAGRGGAFDGTFEIEDGLPVVAQSLAWLTAKVAAAHTVGDHTLFVGEVQHVGIAEAGAPLGYWAGAFCNVSPMTQSS